MFANLKVLTIPEGDVIKIECNDTVLWEIVKYTNLVYTSIDTDGNIYNGTGYRQGYRVSSSGKEKESSYTACTGFIRVTGGDEIRFGNWIFTHVHAGNAVNVFDANFNNIGQMTSQAVNRGVLNTTNGWESVVEETTGVWKWVVPQIASIAYIRVSGFDNTGVIVGEKMIITKNQEII